MKTVLLVPGFKEDIDSRDYQTLINSIERCGYSVRFVAINWTRTLPYDWVKELEYTYKQYNPNETILAGFSFGSIAALVAASNNTPYQLWLFSLSPYFDDDMPNMKNAWLRYIGKKRGEYFKKLKFIDFAEKIKCRTLIFVGEIECKKYPLIKRRSQIANKTISNSSLIYIKEVGHDVAAPEYIDSITKNISI